MENKTVNKKSYSGNILMIIIFVIIISGFTLINLGEFLKQSEPMGRIPGLNQMESIKSYGVTLWGGIQKALGKKLTFGSTDYENVIDLGNGYYGMPDPVESIDAGIKGTYQGMELADGIGVPFLFVFTPPKREASDNVSAGITDYTLSKYIRFSAFLEENNIPSIDMGKEYALSGDYKQYFYHTDHHCNNKGAFLTNTKICDYMENLGFEINKEYTDESAFNIIHYDDIFLGSSGRMTGPLYTGLDDYDLYIPNFDTDLSLSTESQGIYREGTFEDALVYYENLSNWSYDYYAYYAYQNEDYDITVIENKMNPDGANVVILRDSSAVPVSSFLSLQCGRITLISLRYVQDKSVIKDFIIKENPDLIIFNFSTGFLGDEGALCFE